MCQSIEETTRVNNNKCHNFSQIDFCYNQLLLSANKDMFPMMGSTDILRCQVNVYCVKTFQGSVVNSKQKTPPGQILRKKYQKM